MAGHSRPDVGNGALLFRLRHYEIVERSDRIGLGPEAYLPGILERLINRVKEELPVEIAVNPRALLDHPDRMPLAGGRRHSLRA